MRRFLSLLLVVLLLFSLLAIPASAMSAGAVVTAVDGLAAVSAIISGSGVTIAALENLMLGIILLLYLHGLAYDLNFCELGIVDFKLGF